jgi:hypothetical protein
VLISFSDFARLKGVSAPAVTIAAKNRIKDAIVENGGKRMLDRDKALDLWDRNTKRNGSEKLTPEARARARRPLKSDNGSPAGEILKPTPDQLKTLIMGLPEDQIPGLDVSRERKEHYLAEVARMDALAKRGELVPNDGVTKEASRLGRQVRDLLLIIPGRNAASLATMQDAEAIKALLEAEIHTALRGLAND